MTIKKLPTEFKWCEGCKHFEALAYGNVLRCKKLGLVFKGMVICVHRKEERHGVHGRLSSDNDIRHSDNDSTRR